MMGIIPLAIFFVRIRQRTGIFHRIFGRQDAQNSFSDVKIVKNAETVHLERSMYSC